MVIMVIIPSITYKNTFLKKNVSFPDICLTLFVESIQIVGILYLEFYFCFAHSSISVHRFLSHSINLFCNQAHNLFFSKIVLFPALCNMMNSYLT